MSEDFQAVFWSAKRAMAEASEAACRRHGVRAGQQFILRLLWAEDGLTPGEIARRLDLSTATVTNSATRMEAAGLVERRPHPTDARRVRLCLTPRGRELEAIIGGEMRELTGQALTGITPEDRERLSIALTTIRRNLTRQP